MNESEAPSPVALCSRCRCALTTEKNRQYIRLTCPSCGTIFVDYVSDRYVEQLPDFILRHEERWAQIELQVVEALAKLGIDSAAEP